MTGCLYFTFCQFFQVMNDPEVEEPKGIRFSVMVCATRGFPCEGKIL